MSSERKFVEENIRRVLLKEAIEKEIERAGFGGMEIQRTPHGTRISLIVERPGLVIGRKGVTIKKLTKQVEEDFHFDNPQIEVRDSENPNANAQIMAQKLASALERGWHFRRAGHSTVRRIMDGGAKGCMIVISGKLTGQRHRTEKFSRGHIKYCGDTALKWMDIGFAVAKKKLGIIGVKVMIMKEGARLPDEVQVKDPDPEAGEHLILLRPEGGESAKGPEEGEDIVEIIMEGMEGTAEEKSKNEEKKAKKKAEKKVKPKKEKKPKKEAKEAEKKEKDDKIVVTMDEEASDVKKAEEKTDKETGKAAEKEADIKDDDEKE